VTAVASDSDQKIVYWHRELPPLEAEIVAEHSVEANSSRVPGTKNLDWHAWKIVFEAKAPTEVVVDVRERLRVLLGF
jgi:hypothetical protein